ncbi:MAG TPA: hypothetical protein VKQ06_06640, partial [Gammaproteobacteria bacterium]|nr:hypothetical protein [Gammaproteobacteria bacterium]
IRSYNPIAIVIRKPWRIRIFRFYEAFRQFKHGKPHELEAQVSELLAYIQSGSGAGANSTPD